MKLMMFATAKGWSGNRGTLGLRTSPASAFRVLGFAFMLGVAIHASAQTLQLSGQVTDAETGEPLRGANVVRGLHGTSTDKEGRFELAVSPGDSITISFMGYETVGLRPGGSPLEVRLRPAVLQVREIVVVGGLTEQTFAEVSASVSVLDRGELGSDRGSHLQDVTQAVPNLNWAGGTSRPRYFQIRGIGERSHYAGEGPPGFSVGFVFDDIDLSGMGTAGLLFDLDQVEVFKGPQSTILGPNAMAGLINLQSADPAGIFSRRASLSLGNDALLRYDGTVNVPLRPGLAARFGYQSGRSNGFRENDFLDADDSNRRREDLFRAKLRFEADSGLTLLGTVFRADMDNRYDVWSPDNNEDLVTHSDKPGKDRQLTTAASVRGEIPLDVLGAQLVSVTAYSSTELVHSFDGDWGNDGFWLREPYGFDPAVEGWRYDFSDETVRDREVFTQELRLLKDDLSGGRGSALLGAYVKTLEESDDATGYLFGGDATDLKSTFDVDDLAFYGQYGLDLTENLHLSLTARLDRNATTYFGTTDSGAGTTAFDVEDWLAGGKGALIYQPGENSTVYALAARGYRAGGVNQHPYLADNSRPFDPEYMLNFEAGYRFTGRKATTALTLFHALRSDQQVDLSSQQDPGDPNSFVYFIANAAAGRNSGLEVEHTYRPTSRIRLFGSLGYLSTHVDAYTFETADGEELTLGDRAAAHAPQYTFRIGAQYRDRTGLFGRLELSAMDEFYFSDSHNQKSERYQLVNGNIGYGGETWTVSVWARNLLDERYAVRGFFFGLEPPDYPDRLYVTYGDPRQFGLTLTTSFFDRSAGGLF